MINKKCKLLASLLLCMVCLSGCNKTSDEEIELAGFSSSIEDFSNYMKDADEKINGLDVNKKESVDELLSILDGMNSEIEELTTLDVPAQYTSVKQLVETAVKHMNLAVSYYHSAYEADVFNEADAELAYTHYQKAMTFIGYMGYVIAGDPIPEDEQITVYEEDNDEHLFDKWLSGDKDEAGENETASETVPETAAD